MALVPGAMVGPCRLTRVLGSGSQGQAWHADHVGCAGPESCPCDGEGTAVKVLLPGRHLNRAAIAELELEAHALERLSSFSDPWPFAPPFLSYVGAVPAMVMGLGVGQVFDFLALGAFPEPMARTLTVELLLTLARLHERRIAHRVSAKSQEANKPTAHTCVPAVFSPLGAPVSAPPPSPRPSCVAGPQVRERVVRQRRPLARH
jgi:hypothetical protein